MITGDLTINGITKSVDLDAEFFGVGTDAYGRTVLGAEATTTINRHDFKVDWNMPLDGGRLLLGPKIEINLSVEASRPDASASRGASRTGLSHGNQRFPVRSAGSSIGSKVTHG